jgi:hypothetical protein
MLVMISIWLILDSLLEVVLVVVVFRERSLSLRVWAHIQLLWVLDPQSAVFLPDV